MKNYEYVFFDFDGTIVNTINGTKASALYALENFNVSIPENENIGVIFCGPPLRETFKKYLLNDEDIEKAIRLYRKYQSENTIECNELYDGIRKMLEELKKKGKKLIIVTSKLEETAIKILKYFDIFKYFYLVVGATEDGMRVNKKEIMKYAIEHIHDYNSERAIIIGDRVSDIKVGKLNNIDTIGVLYGMDSKEVMKMERPTYYIERPIDILDIII